jgi:hypothetical protein
VERVRSKNRCVEVLLNNGLAAKEESWLERVSVEPYWGGFL